MTRRLAPALLVGIAASALAGGGSAGVGIQKFSATMNAAQEVGAVKAPGATGHFKGSLNGRNLTWKLTFSRLSGPATAAHLHLGKKGVAGPVVLPLCGPCST